MTSNVCLLAIEMTTLGKCELTMELLKGTSIIFEPSPTITGSCIDCEDPLTMWMRHWMAIG